MIQINHSLEVHEKFFHFSADLLHRTCTSNEIINIPCIVRYIYDCPVCLVCKANKQKPITSKMKKNEIKLPPLAHAYIRRSARLRAQKKPNMITQDTLLHNHPPYYYPTNLIKKAQIKTPPNSARVYISNNPTASTHKKNHTNNNNIIKLDIKTLNGLPAPYSVCPPGVLMCLDLSFYYVISTRGFASVLDISRASTLHSFAFPTRSKRMPLHFILLLIKTLQKQKKKVHVIRFDEDGSLARCNEFLRNFHTEFIVIETTTRHTSTFNVKVEIPRRVDHQLTRIALTVSSFPSSL